MMASNVRMVVQRLPWNEKHLEQIEQKEAALKPSTLQEKMSLILSTHTHMSVTAQKISPSLSSLIQMKNKTRKDERCIQSF